MPRSSSLASRILLPLLILSAVTIAGMGLLVGRATSKVREDYDHLALTAAASHVRTVLDLALSELTAANLADNPVVVGAKKAVVVDSLRSFWSRAGLDGIILDAAGGVVASTLPDPLTRAAVADRRAHYFVLAAGGERLRCQPDPFPVWGWSVITIGRHSLAEQQRADVAWLLPLLGVAALALLAAVLLLIWRNLRVPVGRMVADVEASREVRPTGIGELDRIGEAVNWAVARLQVRTNELGAELDRRRQAERELLEKEAHIRLLLESTAEGILGVDRDGNCTFCNPAALRLLERSAPEELLGKNVHRLVHHSRASGGEYPHAECPVQRTIEQGLVARATEDVFWRKGGASFPVEYWSYPVMEAGVLRGAVIGFLDTTERTTLEQQLRQSQKMEALGRLAGGLAHDFNNMLMAITGHASLARESVPEGAPAQGDLDQVLSAAEKAAALTRQILAFSRKRVMSLAPVDLNEIVLGMGKVLSRLLGEDVEVVYRLASDDLVVLADRGQVEQVLLNLWANARDAMPSGGRLVIGSRPFTCDEAAAAAAGLDAPGRYALLTVSDSGVGMDDATRQRVFEPFFTTKEQGKGTGLGLAIAYGIVKQHRGQIDVASAPGQGSTFRVYLPLAAGAAARAAPPAPVAARGGTETILLAEDDEQVRALTVSVLERAGYRVLAARDGAEALALHEAHADRIALCLFDVVMPRLGGREALEAVRRRRPALRALLMSGYAPDRSGQALADAPLLAKPFLPRELLRRVREALDASPPEPPPCSPTSSSPPT